MNSAKTDLVTDGIAEFYEKGVITKTGEKIELDCIVYATGFDMLKSSVEPFEIFGRDGISLNEQWGESPKAFYGCTTKNFPNFFKVYGPNTSSGHNSVLFAIEAGGHYLVECMRIRK